jgi:hypothetical protein
MLKIWRTHPRLSVNNPWVRRHRWEQLRICQAILRGNVNTSSIAAKFVLLRSTNNQTKRRANVGLEVWEKTSGDPTFITMIALFPKLEKHLKWRRFETGFGIRKEPPAILYSVKENDFHGAFQEETMGFCTLSKRLLWQTWQRKLS